MGKEGIKDQIKDIEKEIKIILSENDKLEKETRRLFFL